MKRICDRFRTLMKLHPHKCTVLLLQIMVQIYFKILLIFFLNFTLSTDGPTQKATYWWSLSGPKKTQYIQSPNIQDFLCLATMNWGLNNQYFVLTLFCMGRGGGLWFSKFRKFSTVVPWKIVQMVGISYKIGKAPKMVLGTQMFWKQSKSEQ